MPRKPKSCAVSGKGLTRAVAGSVVLNLSQDALDLRDIASKHKAELDMPQGTQSNRDVAGCVLNVLEDGAPTEGCCRATNRSAGPEGWPRDVPLGGQAGGSLGPWGSVSGRQQNAFGT